MKMNRVLVIGGNGHLGVNLVKVLSEQGFTVRASVRSLRDSAKLKFLRQIPNVELVEAELLDLASLEKAMVGMDGVFHAAAPNLAWSPDSFRDITLPTLQGTQNVFHAVKKSQVQKVIFTSSCAACGMDTREDRPFTELDWNSTSQLPLVKSKIDAECWAWNYSRENQINLVTIHPPTILGPGFQRHTVSTQFYEKIALRKVPPLPEGGCHLIDVRDLAEAHVQAYSNQNASGRYIVAGQFFKMSEFLQFLKKVDPTLQVPGFQFPTWALQGVRFLDWSLHRLTGRPRQATGELLREFVGKYQYVSTAKAKQDLNWNPRPAEETIRDTLDWIREHFLSEVKV